jgi:hypothetical protein
MAELDIRDGSRIERRSRRERSPNYPGISLRKAVDRARELYNAERRHPAPVEAVAAAWGYRNAGSGSATVTVGALKKFGLLDEQRTSGGRILRLSDLAVEVLLNPEPGEALRSAALLPALHREMWDKYGAELPSDRNLRYHLMKRGFTESGVMDFLKVYRETVAFAGLAVTDERRDDQGSEDEALDDGPPESTAFHPRQAGNYSEQVPHAAAHPYGVPQGPSSGLRIPVPLVGGSEVVYVEGNFPITEQAWSQLMTMLSAMKPGLVKPEE